MSAMLNNFFVTVTLSTIFGLYSVKAIGNITEEKTEIAAVHSAHASKEPSNKTAEVQDTGSHRAVKRQILQPNYVFSQYNGLNNSPYSKIGTMLVNNTIVQVYSLTTIPENIISSPVVTNWGDWGKWDNCSLGQYGVGFQLRSEAKKIMKGSLGNTALNAISILCGKPGSNDVYSYPTSTVGPFGDWGDYFYCNGLLIGFQLRSEGDQGSSGDNTAANNMRGICMTNDHKEKIIEGDGDMWGDWTAEQRCDPGKAVCAIQTQVQITSKVKVDKTALNNVKMKCCDIKAETPAKNTQQS